MAEAKNSYQLKYLADLASERYLLGRLATGLELDRTLQFWQAQQDKIQELTLDEIRTALRQILGEAPMVEVKAGDPRPQHADSAQVEKAA